MLRCDTFGSDRVLLFLIESSTLSMSPLVARYPSLASTSTLKGLSLSSSNTARCELPLANLGRCKWLAVLIHLRDDDCTIACPASCEFHQLSRHSDSWCQS